MARTRTLGPEEWAFWDTWMRAQRLLTRELDRGLQRACGISKPEFSLLVTLWRAPGREMRVGGLSASLDWEKSRVSHLLTRMEKRGLVARTRSGPAGRRTGIGLTAEGHRAVQDALAEHARVVRHYALDTLTPVQSAAIRTWSERLIDRIDRDGTEPPATADGRRGG